MSRSSPNSSRQVCCWVTSTGMQALCVLGLAQQRSPWACTDSWRAVGSSPLLLCVSAAGGGLDLLSNVEFQRNYLACVRSHKVALLAQRALWGALLRDTISFRELQVGDCRLVGSAVSAVLCCAWATLKCMLLTPPGPGCATSQRPGLHYFWFRLYVCTRMQRCCAYHHDVTACCVCLQAHVQAMEAAEHRATTVYRRFVAAHLPVQH